MARPVWCALLTDDAVRADDRENLLNRVSVMLDRHGEAADADLDEMEAWLAAVENQSAGKQWPPELADKHTGLRSKLLALQVAAGKD